MQSSTVDGPSSFGIGRVGDQGQSDGVWAHRKTVGRPNSTTSDLQQVPDTILEGSESDIFMLPGDDAGCVQGASRHQSKAFGGPQLLRGAFTNPQDRFTAHKADTETTQEN